MVMKTMVKKILRERKMTLMKMIKQRKVKLIVTMEILMMKKARIIKEPSLRFLRKKILIIKMKKEKIRMKMKTRFLLKST